jgi:hypothetical protein
MSVDLKLGAVRVKTLGAVFAVAVLSLLALGTSARAAGEYELNDSRETAFGPLAGGTWYTGGIETLNDVDWFVFYIKTYSQVEFSATAAEKGSYGSYFYLYDRDGKDYGTYDEDLYAPSEQEEHLALTMTPGRYYLKADGGQGGRYKFRIDPAASITTSRECGEAIVAKDTVAPQLVDANKKLTQNAEKLAPRSAAVLKAQSDLAYASAKVERLRAKVKRLKRQHRSPRVVRSARASLRQARSDAQRAAEAVVKAEEQVRPIAEEKGRLEAIAGQRQQEITTADGQIAVFC